MQVPICQIHLYSSMLERVDWDHIKQLATIKASDGKNDYEKCVVKAYIEYLRSYEGEIGH